MTWTKENLPGTVALMVALFGIDRDDLPDRLIEEINDGDGHAAWQTLWRTGMEHPNQDVTKRTFDNYDLKSDPATHLQFITACDKKC